MQILYFSPSSGVPGDRTSAGFYMQPIDPDSPEARLLPPATISPTNAVTVTIIPASESPAELAVIEQPITVKPTVRIRQ